jgi:hypothetical protein
MRRMRVGDQAREYDQAAVWLARSRGDGALNLGAITYAGHGHVHAKGRAGSLDGARNAHLIGLSRIENDRDASDVGHDFLEHLKPFPTDFVFAGGKPGDVAAWPGQVSNDASHDRIGDRHEDNWYDVRFLLQQRHDQCVIDQDDVGFHSNEFTGIESTLIGIATGPTELDPHVTAVSPSQLLQSLQ